MFNRNNPVCYDDFLGLVVRITYYTARETKEVSLPKGGSAQDLLELLDQIKREGGKICKLHCGGHGTRNEIIINGIWKGATIWTKPTKGTLILSADENSVFLREVENEFELTELDITNNLRELLDDGALIDFNACLTAHENGREQNLSSRVSTIFPNVNVRGSRKYSAGIPFFGEEPFVRTWRTYVGGEAQ